MVAWISITVFISIFWNQLVADISGKPAKLLGYVKTFLLVNALFGIYALGCIGLYYAIMGVQN